ncbi:MAG TPA: hypothetical protein VK633_00805, partial [Verrucomicrobiae bacterium]|nr:hypothetical protein [Verrucomicrobiae bacterium]
KYHSPEVCLPAAGYRWQERGRELLVGGRIPFQFSRYDWVGQPVFVFSSFRSLDGDDPARSFNDFDLNWGKRLRSVLDHRKPSARQVIQVGLIGPSSDAGAQAQFLAMAEKSFVLTQ